MHCPRCGQQQVSNETKFCSKCGFQLGLIPELLQHGGTLPQLELMEQKRTLFNKKNGVGFGFLWLILFLFFAVMWEILDADPMPEICVATGIFGSIAILLGSLIMLPSSRRPVKRRNDLGLPRQQPEMMQGHAAGQALPPPQQQPAGFYTAPHGAWRTPDTGELAERGSVVENTTKLLNHEERS
ncbi:MAG: hypothetical protein IT174_14580 [Acidobacteria bacterium]|nr:hypothetical protein [Acidobacteriota bacterium]